MRDLDFSCVIKVGNRAAELEHTMITARAQLELPYGKGQNPAGFLVQPAELINVADGHVGIGEEPRMRFEPMSLPAARFLNALANVMRALGGRVSHQLVEIDARHINMDINAIDYRS